MGQTTIQQSFESALQHHQAGRAAEAEKIYRQILAKQPEHAGATHFLGVLAQQSGRNDVAVELLRRAIALNPKWPDSHFILGNALKNLGRLDEAIAAYGRAIALKPNFAEAFNNLGVALKDNGQLEEAIEAHVRAIKMRPDYAMALNNLGEALRVDGQFDASIAVCRQAVALKPDYAEAYCNLGNALSEKGNPQEAVGAYRRAIAIRPNYGNAFSNLGNALWEVGQVEEAIAACRHAVMLGPNSPESHNNLGNVLAHNGQSEEAIAAYQQAIALRPSYAEAYSNLGNVLEEAGRVDAAIAAYRQAIGIKPEYAGAHNNISLALLLRGDFQEGWEEHEWRWKCRDFPSPQRDFAQPLWDGGRLDGRTILIHAEQGFGDAIQFIRYLPMVAERGGKVIIESPAELEKLVRRMAVGCQVVVRGEALPAFDVHCPLLTLPKVFGTKLENIPNSIPYLQADALESERWRERLTWHCSLLTVGLVWAGNPSHKNDRNRSMKLGQFAPLGRVPGVQFVSLQKGEAAAEGKMTPAGMQLVDWTGELKDFGDAAALIASLDLVIAVDTAIVHLAGAMGKPVWTLLPFVADWRWLSDREDSPWYPTMRLFRQPGKGDWGSVIARVAGELSHEVKNRG